MLWALNILEPENTLKQNTSGAVLISMKKKKKIYFFHKLLHDSLTSIMCIHLSHQIYLNF